MFPVAYFADGLFAPVYFAKAGAAPGGGGSDGPVVFLLLGAG